jgi:hypothetical protein
MAARTAERLKPRLGPCATKPAWRGLWHPNVVARPNGWL